MTYKCSCGTRFIPVACCPNALCGRNAFLTYEERVRAEWMVVVKDREQMLRKAEAENARLRAVVEAARQVNKQLNEWPLIRQHSYAHENLHKALKALDAANAGEGG